MACNWCNGKKALLAVGLFASAIALASFGFLYLPVALAATAGLMVLFDIVPIRQVYDTIEWPVIVLLGCMDPDWRGDGNNRSHSPHCQWYCRYFQQDIQPPLF